MTINKEALSPYLLYNLPIKYKDITLYPVTMKDIIPFQTFQPSITIRKDSIFREKKIIKMSYLDFLKYTHGNYDFAIQYKDKNMPLYWTFAVDLLLLCCGNDAKITYNKETLDIYINDMLITSEIFDDLRKIIILQNDIDFNIDEFMNIDTFHALEKAKEFEMKKNKEKVEIEDYIDSLIVALGVTEEYISNLSVRKFWRYIRRVTKHEEYNSSHTAELSGMVTFKTPITHWMTSINIEDKYKNVKADEEELRSKIEG